MNHPLLFDLVRLAASDLSARLVSTSLAVSKTTVGRYRRRIRERGYTWEALRHLPASALSACFRQPRPLARKPLPDFAALVPQLEEPGVTGRLLWEEYAQARPEAERLSYAQFLRRLNQAAYGQPRGLSLRQHHLPGDRVYVDFSGRRLCYQDRETGERVPIEIFVAVLPASNYIFACGCASQSVPDFLDAHVRMLAFFGGAPRMLVPDNLKAAVTKAGRDPTIQRNYLDFARHYGMAVLPARPGHPRDKGAVEGAVLMVQRQILARLRRRVFFSLAEANAAVAELLTRLNERPFQKRAGTRRAVFEATERAALVPLPATPFAYASWGGAQTVPPDYHVCVGKHYYSVPHTWAGKPVEPCRVADRVRLFCEGQCVADHAASTVRGGRTTDIAHLPESHRSQVGQSPATLLAWADTIGPATRSLAAHHFAQEIPLQGMPAVQSMRGLAHRHGAVTLERAAAQALAQRSRSIGALRAIVAALDPPVRPALRGPEFYRQAAGEAVC
ncbi:MAG: IS21 family transposase [Rudaea sp.]|uniref:IS21 family transposase n=1 Tax=unclassified Rudaea TaxID=2627037 RepID=UPI001484E993|nr:MULTISPECIES: IS21 family transposase [unclassified Rudaea]MBN8888006.1 IS21 family transposase [Rudaea sp.]